MTRGATVHAYGAHPSQFGELSLPDGTARGVVVVIHGGFWRQAYGLDLGRPLAADLAARGWAAWNLEYRRVGNGGGAPATFDDVAAGIDALADLNVDLRTVVTLGHSAGGHLAAWAASRGRFAEWEERVSVSAVISQAGVLDLAGAHARDLGGGAVRALLGHPPAAADDRYDPIRRLPLGVPVRCLHAADDEEVPLAQSADYVAAAKDAGADAELVVVEGDHYTVIDPASPAWARTRDLLDRVV